MFRNRDQQLDSPMRCAKYMLLTVSAMFMLTAILLVMVGTTIQAIFGNFDQFLDDHFSSPPALLVAIGFILLLVAGFGGYGALKESVLLINLYGVLLFLVFILEVAAAIAAFVMQGQVRHMLERSMFDSLNSYSENEYVRYGVDFMQQNLQCCGVNLPNDWEGLLNNTDLTQTEDNEIDLPISCCGEFEEVDRCLDTFSFGCLRRLEFIISQSTMLIATGATTVAFVQLLGVFCAFMLAKTLRRNKSLREARRCMFQQSLSDIISDGKMPPPMNSPMTGYTQLEKAERYMDTDPVTYTPSSPSVN